MIQEQKQLLEHSKVDYHKKLQVCYSLFVHAACIFAQFFSQFSIHKEN